MKLFSLEVPAYKVVLGGERQIMGYESLYMVSVPIFIEFPRLPGDTGNRVGCTIFEREGQKNV